jgi:aryl-alcohol dehydrogenase-like predicted oxidoreductase
VEQRRLGSSDLMISPIGLGTWAIGGGDWFLGWGPQDDWQSIATIRRAVRYGINWIDTAAVFGLGHAEKIIARAMRAIPKRDRPFIFTRCGLVWDDLGNVSHDLTAASIRSQAEASLRRLGVDCIDLFQIGWPVWPLAHQAGAVGSVDEAWDAMASLQREGKARFIGVASCTGNKLDRLQTTARVTSVSVPYSLLRREVEPCLRSATDQDVAVIACSTLASGLLTGTMTPDRVLPFNDWRRRHAFVQELALTRAATFVERLRSVGERHRVAPAAVAVAWALRHPAITAAVVGARKLEQIDELACAVSCPLTDEDAVELTTGRGQAVNIPV